MELNATQHWTIARLAYWYLDRGRYREAEALARGLLSLNQRSGTAWKYYGEARLQQGDHDEAVRAFEEASRLLEDDPRAWMRFGETLLRMERYGRAGRALEQARRHADGETLLQRITALQSRCGVAP